MVKLAWKNIVANPFGSILSISLVTLSVGLVVFFGHISRQFQSTMENNTAGVHLILAAKGSPLQAVLSNLYHIDNPTGNIQVNDVKAFFNPRHPLINQAIPLSIGDSYRSHRIVGTTQEIANLYAAELGQGNWWQDAQEVVVGAKAARDLSLNIGDVFQSSHGLVDDGMDHSHDDDLVVVGILKRSGTVLDNLILTSYATIWAAHAGHSDTPTETESHEHHDHDHDHEHHDHEHHDHGHATITPENEVAELLNHPDEEITAVLLTFKNHNHQTLNMMRSINENATFQAAHPAWELNRLYSMVGTGTTLLTYLAWLIGLVSFVSIFLSLLQSLRARKYELALLRVLGATPGNVSGLIVFEAFIQVGIGLILGLLLAHFGLFIVDALVEDAYRYQIEPWIFNDIDLKAVLIVLLLGLITALWPAWRAYRTDVSKTLQQG